MGHTVVSLGIGTGVWAATGSLPAVPAAVAAGVLVDSDHVLDYFQWYVKKDLRRVFVLLHGWEYGIAGLALVFAVKYNPVLLGAVLGYLGHLTGDHLANKPDHPLSYSIVYRVYRGFNRGRLFQEGEATLSEALNESIPLWELIEPRLLAMASRIRGRGR